MAPQKIYGRLVIVTPDGKEGKIIPIQKKRLRWGSDVDCEFQPGPEVKKKFAPKVITLDLFISLHHRRYLMGLPSELLAKLDIVEN